MSAFTPPGLDWQPDLPDYRDYSLQHERVQQLLLLLKRRSSSGLPRLRVDLREFFPAIACQQHLRWSPAYACVAMAEYFERRVFGRLANRSVAFVYKMTRKLLQREGDTGTNLRTTLKAITRFGIPPAQYWPDEAGRFDAEPDAFLHSLAKDFRPAVYVRLDSRNTPGSHTLATIKAFLAAGFPCVLGFSVPESISTDADIPWRPTFDSLLGGQVVVAAGYDDQRIRTTKGALLIRNCWGSAWGEQGYGWLPYRYIEQQLAGDCWTMLRESWLESGEFQMPMVEALAAERT